MKLLIPLVALLAITGCAIYQAPDAPQVTRAEPECVILLHGLIRSPSSMGEMEEALDAAGYLTVNDGYPSRDAKIDVLDDMAITPALEKCHEQGADRISFVTHSLGGILVRSFLESQDIEGFGRVVMLAPPNHGSEVVDSLRNVPGVTMIYGPTFVQLGTDDASVPLQLGAADYSVGIIAGQVTNVFSGMLPVEDDGSVTVASARLEGMTDFLVLEDAGHTFIMNNNEVIRQTLFFLENGRFDGDADD